MFRELKDFFEDDYIKTKWFRAKPFTLLWWIIRIGQTALTVVGLWGFYVLMWLALT